MNKNIKIILGITYLISFSLLFYLIFSYVDLKDLTSYKFIRENSLILVDIKNNNLIIFSIIFIIFSIIWILLLGFATPLALASGFIFGQWLGTIISLVSLTAGCTLLYLLAQIYFKEIIIKHIEPKIKKYKKLFNENEFLYFTIFRFCGGAGIPFCIQNILPVIFNMKIINYFFASLIGLTPVLFITNALGQGIKNVLSKNQNIYFIDIISDPNIFMPIAAFITIILISIFIKKFFFK